MTSKGFMAELEKCELCEHRCRANRLKGETGVCKATLPIVASATLHPAPPESYTVFMAGCNFKCLHCQNWTISQYPDNGFRQRGYIEPQALAAECIRRLSSTPAKLMGADRIFFSGGEPGIHLPYIERVVAEARKLNPRVRVNFDTNGYLTENSFARVLQFTTSITYDLKAYQDENHLALTGAKSPPVLRNAEYLGRHAKDKLWEYRIVVIPRINESEIKRLTDFIASIDPGLPVNFLAFRPNYVLERHPGATAVLMESCLEIAKTSGLQNAYWSGYTGIPGAVASVENTIRDKYTSEQSRLAGSYAFYAGCRTHPRSCSACQTNQNCQVKKYIPKIST
ncbi:MAG: radical SAM protein [Desulfobacterales bacterium]|nr:MAG: radical SAM protein [Desulfobacterales bacterium]